jgi:hypothetical protein
MSAYIASWDRLAAVRKQPRRLTLDEDQSDGRFFSHRLIPVLRHPALRSLGAPLVERFEALCLQRYMASIESVETELVNPALLEIIKLPGLPLPMRVSAYKIYTDEGYHAFMSAELRAGIAHAFSLPEPLESPTRPLRRILNWIRALPPQTAAVALVTAASMNETLITGYLLQAQDPGLRKCVRECIRIHAQDESGHHGYFVRAFPAICRAWPPAELARVRERLSWLLFDLLRADVDAVARDLSLVGVPAGDAREIARQAHPPLPALAAIEKSARGCLAMLASAGLYERDDLRRDHAKALSLDAQEAPAHA